MRPEDGAPPDPLSTLDPIAAALGDGRQILVRGRVDRIDLLSVPGVRAYTIWDYKTGGTWGYNPADPFREGRMLQPYLYVTMVEHRLLESIGPAARVGLFGFFFPARKGAGERIAWTPGELKDGGRIVELLTRIVASGAFLPTTNSDQDCKFCDFLEVCGNVKYVSAGSRLKLAFSQNPLVEPLRELRAP
jgi:ATP-dependent helicase/nuclease subunit B